MNVEYHRWLISNPDRLRAYARAIEAAVGPDTVVVDAGAGTGLLSLIAARAGAKRVYAVEQHGVIEVARENVARSGFSERVICIQADAGNVELPEPADLVISDLIGVFGVDLDIRRVYAHLTSEFLRPGGRVLPERIEVFFAPWEAPDLHQSVAFWNSPLAGFDLSAMRRVAANRPTSVVIPPEGSLAAAELHWTLDLRNPKAETLTTTRTHRIAREGLFHGVAGWFRAELRRGTLLDSGPDQPILPWRQGFLPLEEPLHVGPGDELDLCLTATQEPDRVLLGWAGELRPADGSRPSRGFTHHEFLGEFLPRPVP